MTERHGWRAGVDETDIEECCERIRELKENGHLFAPDEAGFQSAACSLVLLMEDGGTAMDFDTGCRALDALMERSGVGECLPIEFRCGSEAGSRDVIDQLIGYARREGRRQGRKIQFSQTVGGVLTDRCMAGSTGYSALSGIRRGMGSRKAVRIYGAKNDLLFAGINHAGLIGLKGLLDAEDELFSGRLSRLLRKGEDMVFAFYHYMADLPAEIVLTAAPGGRMQIGGVCGEIIGNVWDGAEAGRSASTAGEERAVCAACWARPFCVKAREQSCGAFREKAERRIVLDMLAALTDGRTE